MATSYDQTRRMYASAVAASDRARAELTIAKMTYEAAVRTEREARADEARWLATLIAGPEPVPEPEPDPLVRDRNWGFVLDVRGIDLSPRGAK